MNKPGRTAALRGGRLICVFITLLLPFLLWLGTAWARSDGETLVAMVARVMPAVVRVVTVRPGRSAKRAADHVHTDVGAGYIIDPSG